MKALFWCWISGIALLPSEVSAGVLEGGAAARVSLPDYDRRHGRLLEQLPEPIQSEALAQLKHRAPQLEVSFHPITGAPRRIYVRGGFLGATNDPPPARGATTSAQASQGDPDRATKNFLKQHAPLFGHGPEALEHAQIRRQFVGKPNGLRSVVWEQEVAGVPVFEARLIAHTTRQGQLVALSSGFLPDAEAAAARAAAKGAAGIASAALTARQAVALAVGDLGENLPPEQLRPIALRPASAARDPRQRQSFTAATLKGKTDASLIWLPTGRDRLRLCWDVVLMSRARDEMFRILIDAQTGEPLLRRCLTESISPATYRVYTSDSPSPFSPGSATPTAYQPPVIPRTLLTLSAVDTNASPNGWINDGDNETLGNNVDAHTDHDGDDLPDLPRPQGSPFRVFDFPIDLSKPPATNAAAAVVQLFYWCNWAHDQLYDLGFTEAAGNFQTSNFGRGGEEGDAVLADAQDGKGYNNANFSTPPDGSPGRMQMYLFSYATPNRDSDLDGEIILHEYAHGLSNRRVGGGVGLNALQSRGMGEGWSDFMALSLLSAPTDEPNANYAIGAYVTYNLLGLFNQNYYFGIRRYPYTTGMDKNPLTFKDIDPQQANAHAGIPSAPYVLNIADEVHNMGEVWCVTLWQARANLIAKYGAATGNQLMLQLVMDGMNLAPPDPTFLEARDAILQADQVDNNGANQQELWSAFAKRGMGVSAECPASSTTAGVFESFDLSDELKIFPAKPLYFAAQSGSADPSVSRVWQVVNTGTNEVSWTLANATPWLTVSPLYGTLAGGSSNIINVVLNQSASTLTGGTYFTSLVFSNLASGITQQRGVTLHQVPSYASWASLQVDPGWQYQGQWAFGSPAGLGGAQNGFPDPTVGTTGTNVLGVNLSGDYDTAPGGPYYLVAGPFNLSQCFATKLSFQRWLNTDCQPYVDAIIEISTDGTNWSRLWSNGNQEIADDHWLPITLDISKYADNHSRVFLRWGYAINSSLANAYSGWNLDDIEVSGVPSTVLTLSLPPALAEGNGPLSATVRISSILTNNLAVSLACNNPAAISLPTEIVIPAGATNATFNLAAVDNEQLDGSRQVTLLAAAPRCVPATGSLLVTDNEAATLSVSVPDSAQEGQGAIFGSVQLGGTVPVDTTITFTSSIPSEIAAPEPLIISAGQKLGNFVLPVLDDGEIDGTRMVTITAMATGWTNGSATIAVIDNENTNLTVTLPSVVWETDGILPDAGAVTISGTLPTNLVVALASDVPAHLQLPATVTIVAGQTNQGFNLSVLDDGLQTGNLPAGVTATADGFNAGSASLVIQDAENPPMPANPSPADGQTNVDQRADLAWQPGVLPRGTITNRVYFGTRPDLDDSDLVGKATDSAWPLPVLAPQTTYYWKIVAENVGTTSGPVWQFTTHGVDHFVWDPIPSPQFVNTAFSVAITAMDGFGNIVSNFSGTVNLSGQSYPAASIALNESFESGVLSNWQAGASVTAYGITNEWAADGTNSLFIAGGGQPFAGLWHALPASMPDQIDFAVRATATNQAGANFVLGDTADGEAMTDTNVVFAFAMRPDATMGCDAGSAGSATVPYQADQWYHVSVRLDWMARRAAVFIDGSLAFPDVPFRSAANQLASIWLYNSEDTLSGWDAIQVAGHTSTSVIPISPPQSGPFAGGRWEGSVTMGLIASNAVLQADDGQGHSRLSGSFTVLLTNDISLSLQAAPDPAVAGQDLLYTLVVTNTGAADATEVQLIDELPPGSTFVSARASQGSCVETNGIVSCQFGLVPGGTNATIAIAIVPRTAGLVLTNRAMVTRAELDGSTDDNQAQLVTFVAVPEISVFNQAIAQSVLTTTNLGFPIQLSAPSAQTVTVQYATSDGTAVAGLDYLSTNGVVSIPPGSTSAVVSITITVGSSGQPDRDFNLLLSDPTNATLVIGSALGHITCPPAVVATIDHFAWSLIPALQITEAPFTVTIAALDVSGALVTNFSGVAFLSASASGSSFTAVPISPMVSAPFNLGVWSGDLTVFSPALAVTLKADDGDGHVGLGNSFNVLPPGNAPTIIASPTNLVALQGDSAEFAAEATGAPELVYQWSFNGTNLAGATNQLLLLTNVQPADAGAYAVRVANAYGFDTSSNAWLVVNEPAHIVQQPTNQAVLPGDHASFGVLATGTSDLAYQWFFNSTNLDGATNNFLILTNVQDADVGEYTVLVTNSFGAVTSSVALLIVNEPAHIIQQPSSLAVVAGDDASFTVSVIGAPEFSYQWMFNGQNLPDATNSVLVLTNVQTEAAGTYAVMVANAFGFDTSSNAVLTVNVPAQILQPPTNANAIAGMSASFSVLAAGTPELSYQWLFNGTNLTDATNSLLVITNVQLADTGPYAVQVSNAFGGEISGDVTLALVEPAGIAEQPVDLMIMAGSNASFSVIPTGTPDFTYQWTLNGTNLVGATNNPLWLTSVPATAAGLYAVEVSNAYGRQTSSNALLIVNDAAHIVRQPANRRAAIGSNTRFTVAAAGTLPLFYQWSFNGELVVDATTSRLSLTNVQDAQAGLYAVLVSNQFGFEMSSNASLTVVIPAQVAEQPTNLTVQVGDTATFSVIATGTPEISYQWFFNTTNLEGATNQVLTLTNVQLEAAGLYAVQVSNAFGFDWSSNAQLVVQSPPGPPPCAATATGLVGWWSAENNAWDNVSGAVGTLYAGTDFSTGRVGMAFSFPTSSAGVDLGDPEQLKFTNSFSLEAWVWVEALPEQGSGQILFRGNPWPCQAAYSLSVQPSAAVRFQVGDDSGATLCGVDLETPAIVLQQWTHVAAIFDAAGGTMQVYLNGELAAQTNALVRPPGDLSGGGVVIGNNSPGNIAEPLQGRIDELAVYDRALSALEIKAIVDSGESGKCPLPAVVLVNPTAQIVPRDSNVTFSVVAAGSWPVSYQWRMQGTNLANSTHYSGVTLSQLTIANAQLTDRGNYSVLVSNKVGMVESAPANLFVYALDHFTWAPMISPRLTNQPFAVSLQARDPNNEIVTNFGGNVALSSTNGVVLHPGISDNFVLGTWTGMVWVNQVISNLVLSADDGAGHLGTAAPISVIGRPRIEVLKTGNSILVTWPVEASGLVLETCPDLSSQNWMPFTGPISPIGDDLGIRLSLSLTNGFYRLRFPSP